MGGVML